ncbi:33225_t:CDS:2, partial [Racocetra persica]
KKLANLEEKASMVIRDIIIHIIEASQPKGQIVLLRKNLYDLQGFIQEHNIKIRWKYGYRMFEKYLDITLDNVEDNSRIFSIDKLDYKLSVIDSFLAIWQAGSPFLHGFHWFYVIFPNAPHPPPIPGYVIISQAKVNHEFDKFISWWEKRLVENEL